MNKESKDFLISLLKTPSPSGFEEPVQKVVRDHMKKYADEIKTDLHGNVIVGINTKAKRRIMLAGHCDQIGFMVKSITNEGFVQVMPVGGIDAGVMPGSYATIYAEKGPIQGIFGRKPIHLQSGDERSKMTLDVEKAWLDIGAKNKKEAEKLIGIGDPITYRLEVTELKNNLICAPGLDDKTGLFVAMETLKLLAKKKLNVAVYAASTVQEEIGLRGAKTSAYSIDPEVGIAIDVTFASDNPGSEPGKLSPCKLGGGPAIVKGPNSNPVVERMLVATAKKYKIPYQPAPSSGPLGNDANAIQVSKAGVAAGSIGLPNRYMHTQIEVCSLVDLENSAKLLAHFAASITAKTDFTPMGK